jgi:hypothetical protein
MGGAGAAQRLTDVSRSADDGDVYTEEVVPWQ